ncbi:MAG: hypothetical protein EOS11_18095 [Mesorhizobium sp.]|nr:MAG: hypothetical protein EOS11_18095 [Mesorhizobium sp.]
MSDLDKVEDEKNARTSPIGLYHYAVSYHEAARLLARVKLNTTHPESPIYFLHYHAIELFLKAFLRLNGVSVTDLASKKFGHNAKRLGNRASELGLHLDDEDVEVLRLMSETEIVIRSRYISTGYFTIPTVEAVDRTCASLRNSTREATRRSGTIVRP